MSGFREEPPFRADSVVYRLPHLRLYSTDSEKRQSGSLRRNTRCRLDEASTLFIRPAQTPPKRIKLAPSS